MENKFTERLAGLVQDLKNYINFDIDISEFLNKIATQTITDLTLMQIKKQAVKFYKLAKNIDNEQTPIKDGIRSISHYLMMIYYNKQNYSERFELCKRDFLISYNSFTEFSLEKELV